MVIRPAHPRDISRIEELYDEAIAYQRQGGHPFWRDLDLGVVGADIEAGNQYVLEFEQNIAGIFSFCAHSALDEDIWHGRHPESARYIHRIIVGRQWQGRALIVPMLTWCERETQRLGLHALRLDTWAENASLIAYYSRFGFIHQGVRVSSAGAALPPQYRALRLAIMERCIA